MGSIGGNAFGDANKFADWVRGGRDGGTQVISTQRPDYTPGVRATSKAALREHGEKLATIGDKIVSFMVARPTMNFTRAELAKALDVTTATMSGRVNELLREGRVKVAHKRPCAVTGNKVGALVLA